MSLAELHNEIFESDEISQEELEKIAEAQVAEDEEIASDYVAAGRFMARGYANEMEKLAGKSQVIKALLKPAKKVLAGAKKAPEQVGKYFTKGTKPQLTRRALGAGGLLGTGIVAGRTSK